MEPKEYIAAIDLGTSKILGMIGSKSVNNNLEILAFEKIDSTSCIRRGTINNLEETSANLKYILRKLENKIHPHKLARVFVGVNGQSVHTVSHKEYIHLGHEEFITDEIIQKLIQNATKNASVNGEILEVIPNEYRLDSKKTEINPVGVACTEIEASFKLIVGRTSLKKMIARAVEEKTELTIAGTPLSQRAAASVLLTDADKILGCALIDFGAGTTSVSVYKDGLLRHLAVIPFGGQIVTKDISSENLLEGDAEKLKTSYGSAVFNPESDNKVFKVRGTSNMDEPKIELHTLNNIIEARMIEIIQNVWHQIEQSGFAKQLGAGIYITGGASQMRNITDLIKSETGVDVRKASISRNIINSTSSTESMQNPAYGVVLGLVMSNSLNCIRVAKPVVEVPETVDDLIENKVENVIEPVRPPKAPKPKGPKMLDRIKNSFGSLFGESENMDSDMK